jgi:hypothetical protein
MTSADLTASEVSFPLRESASPLPARLLQLAPTALTAFLLAGLAVLLLLPQVAGRSGNQSPPVRPNVLQPAAAPDTDTFTLYLVDSDAAAAALHEALVWYVLQVAPPNRGFEVVVASAAADNDPAALVSETWQRFQRSDVRFVVIDLRAR